MSSTGKSTHQFKKVKEWQFVRVKSECFPPKIALSTNCLSTSFDKKIKFESIISHWFVHILLNYIDLLYGLKRSESLNSKPFFNKKMTNFENDQHYWRWSTKVEEPSVLLCKACTFQGYRHWLSTHLAGGRGPKRRGVAIRNLGVPGGGGESFLISR